MGWVVMKHGDLVLTAATSIRRSAKLYRTIGGAKSVARANDGTVCEAFIEVTPE